MKHENLKQQRKTTFDLQAYLLERIETLMGITTKSKKATDLNIYRTGKISGLKTVYIRMGFDLDEFKRLEERT